MSVKKLWQNDTIIQKYLQKTVKKKQILYNFPWHDSLKTNQFISPWILVLCELNHFHYRHGKYFYGLKGHSKNKVVCDIGPFESIQEARSAKFGNSRWFQMRMFLLMNESNAIGWSQNWRVINFVEIESFFHSSHDH